jgi:hypothetical protein
MKSGARKERSVPIPKQTRKPRRRCVRVSVVACGRWSPRTRRVSRVEIVAPVVAGLAGGAAGINQRRRRQSSDGGETRLVELAEQRLILHRLWVLTEAQALLQRVRAVADPVLD